MVLENIGKDFLENTIFNKLESYYSSWRSGLPRNLCCWNSETAYHRSIQFLAIQYKVTCRARFMQTCSHFVRTTPRTKSRVHGRNRQKLMRIKLLLTCDCVFYLIASANVVASQAIPTKLLSASEKLCFECELKFDFLCIHLNVCVWYFPRKKRKLFNEKLTTFVA